MKPLLDTQPVTSLGQNEMSPETTKRAQNSRYQTELSQVWSENVKSIMTQFLTHLSPCYGVYIALSQKNSGLEN